MAARDVDAAIDRLYQLPLEEFTKARNALAKDLARAEIKRLEKPNLAAWGVNQLYWRERAAYDALVKAAQRLRAEHRKLLSGKSSDLRASETAHRDAIRAALQVVQTALLENGHAASDATITAVRETLEALPSDDPPGRLTRPLKPMGFEALAGIKPSGLRPAESEREPRAERALTLVKSPGEEKRGREEARRWAQEERERQARQRQAEKELKAAESAMLRAEEAVKKAEKTLSALRAQRDEAVAEYQRVRLRARE